MQIGVTDWNLKLTGQPSAIALAKQLGFAGVQVSIGRTPVNGKMPLSDHKTQMLYQAESMKVGLPINGTCLDILHVNYLKNDKLGQQWVAEGIEATKALEVEVMLLPFFGKGALETRAEMDRVADILKELAPAAAKAKVTLAIENTISAEDNARILDRVGSKAVKVFYDTGNSANAGFDVYKEIRWLGAKRIAQVHLKDKGYLGDGDIDFPKVMRALADAGFKGWANLETNAPSGIVEADMRRNLIFVQKVMKASPKA